MKKIYAEGEIVEGRLKLKNPIKFKLDVSNIKGEVDITVGKRERTRSTGRKDQTGNQNGYYWSVVIKMICDYTGETEPMRIHDALKMKFLAEPVGDGKVGRTLMSPGSTAGLNTWDFEQYLEKVRYFAAMELNIAIPLPNELNEQLKVELGLK